MRPNVIPCFERKLPRLWIAPGLWRILTLALFATGAMASPANEKRESREVIEPLTAGAAAHRTIDAGKMNSFKISLQQHQVLRLSIEKGDLALALTIYGADGEKLLEDASNRYETLETLLPANANGEFRLEIRSLETAGAARTYDLRIDSLNFSTAADLRICEAQQWLARASLLRADWTEKSLRQAVEYYDRATAIALATDFRIAAIADMQAGETSVALGEYRAALKRYLSGAEAARHAEDQLLQAQAESEIGRLLSYLGRNNDAQAHLVKALGLLDLPSADKSENLKQVYAAVLSNAGEVSYAKGDLLKASADFDRSITLFTAVNDRAGEARVHLYQGYIAGSLGEPERAVAEISRALNLFQAVKNRSGEARCLTALGLSHSLRRDEEQAIKLHHEAGDIFRAIGDRQNEAITFNGLGQAYEFLSQYPLALENYQKSLDISLGMGDLDFAAVVSYKVARAYRLMGDLKRALAQYEECLRLSRSAGKRRTEAIAINDVALIYAAQGDLGKTIDQYRKLLKFYVKMSDRRGQATTLNNLGDSLWNLGNKREALGSYKRALPLSEQTGDKDLLTTTLYNIARVERDLGALDSGLTNIKRSINEIENMRTTVTSPGFRMSYFSSARKHYDLYIDILMRLERARPGKGFAATALMASESARARSLLDVLTEAHADIRQGAAPQLLERERRVRALIRSQAQYQMELSSSANNSAESEQVKSEINQLESEYFQIEADLRSQNPRFLSLCQAAPLTLDQIKSQLADHETILLEYALGEERSYLWAVTADSLRTYDLPARAVIEAAAREVHDLLVARETISADNSDYPANVETSDRAYFEKAAYLSQLLLGDVASQLGNKRLLIVTEGIMQYVPFDALPNPSNRRSSTTGTSLDVGAPSASLIDAHEIVMLPSISSIAAIRAERRRTASRDKLVAVLADPVFSNNDDRLKKDQTNGSSLLSSLDPSNQPALRDFEQSLKNGSTMRLIHTSEEAEAILATAPRGTVLVAKDFDANREKVMSSQVGEYQIVHFATHGFFNTEHPEFSGIVLSMINQDGVRMDGFLPLEDIYRLKLSSELVVLSACDTALGKNVQGEGVVGLTRGFMYAGARSVVTSLWKVDDRATAALMKEFYRSMLQDGMTPASALRAAKLKIREKETWSAPYFWAGFVLQGEYKDHIEVQQNSQFRTMAQASMTVALISITLILAYKGWHFQRRRRSVANTHAR